MSAKFFLLFPFLLFCYLNSISQNVYDQQIKTEDRLNILYSEKVEFESEYCYTFPAKLSDGKYAIMFSDTSVKTPAIIGCYKDSVPNGTWLSFYKNGKVYKVVNFVNGVYFGPTTSYLKKGGIEYIGNYSEDTSLYSLPNNLSYFKYSMSGRLSDFFNTNSKAKECHFPTKDGMWFCFSENKISEIYTYKQGMLNGLSLEYRKGRIVQENYCSNDTCIIINAYDTNGCVLIKGGEGVLTSVDKDGSRIVRKYKKGYLNIVEIYSPKGNLLKQKIYINGIPSGNWKEWNEEGFLINEFDF